MCVCVSWSSHHFLRHLLLILSYYSKENSSTFKDTDEKKILVYSGICHVMSLQLLYCCCYCRDADDDDDDDVHEHSDADDDYDE